MPLTRGVMAQLRYAPALDNSRSGKTDSKRTTDYGGRTTARAVHALVRRFLPLIS